MAHLHHNLPIVAKGSGQELFWRCRGMMFCNMGLGLPNQRRGGRIKNRGFVHWCTSSTSTPTSSSADQQANLAGGEKLDSRINEDDRVLHFTSISAEHYVSSTHEKLDSKINEDDLRYLVRDGKWQVRRMLETQEEMREVANVQAEAFHEPAFFFDDVFFKFFKAEVFAGLMYRLRNSPPDRYACLVAEARDEVQVSKKEVAGVVDATVLREDSVLEHLLGAKEYIYVSGIAVLNKFRRQKVATALLNACDALSATWGFDYLVLRAYEDDHGARKLYTNAGYTVVSQDPPWTTSWIGRRRRVLMVKQINI
ncbi:GCN5-related N-acetyltransferase 10, chloroplastic isoform X2 [Salvia miltiorrhiza]|uniref:GCN5-related N-acetyltransferase 10, chloroplastic isoform X2 n=1 Tax=Salvia miltiorrhiza TaxID=226208 RepID=UPI0025ACE988|nr:GCN5-related N-acetyltransferase 10, chloroplastic isoform X2 [Salvia miltiorrhiza]